MTAMDRNMAAPLSIFLLIILGLLSIATLLGNGFIIVVNSHSWLQRKKLVLCDLLLTCLSIFRVLMQSAALSGQYIYATSPMDFMCSYAWKGTGIVWVYFNMANFTGTTCLIVFYCVKVTTFTHSLLLWLKSRINRLMPHMLVTSLIVMVISSSPSVLNYWRMKARCNPTRNLTANTSHTEASEEALIVIFNPLQFSFSAINFSICLIASILLIISLWRHTKTLKTSSTGAQDFSTQAHIKVIKQLVFFLFFYILYFVTMIITLEDILHFGAERLSSDIILSLYPSAHSIILIWTNPKLKGVFTRILPTRERSP